MYLNRRDMQSRLLAEFNGMSQEPTKTWDQVRDAFVQLGYVFEPDDVQRCILFCLPGCDLQKVPVIALLSKLRTTYHDLSASR